ncbi:MerR family transcriptional regulator [Streptomyces caniferus]|uniref:MerR family transcriptional regulator n=1 Tax=Streptomyces caniferus TaxID=285557 RepID=A0A640SIN2_9ACTN|nr:MerR family transcriptional regulator [Streptomyces caniferus]GFE11299.1 MerR family transcriptional regulator [Streptomyces caniferus]
MFTIGDFAQYGRVSARMLRHYDAIGLLRPARTDPVSGYRFYEAAQLARLNRIIALKDLGFSLQQVRAILAEEVSVPELRGMLRLRRAELEAALTAAGARLAQVEARLRTIESEGRMSADDVVVKRTETVLLAELSGRAASYGPEDIGPVIQPLYDELCRLLETAGVTPAGPGLAYYEDAPVPAAAKTGGALAPPGEATPNPPAHTAPGGDAVLVHAGMVITHEALAKAGVTVDRASGRPGTPSAAPVPTGLGFDVVMLPALDCAATVVHRGPMSRILPTAQNLAHWIDANGYRSAGYARELYLECPPDQEDWVTEIQEPVVRA